MFKLNPIIKLVTSNIKESLIADFIETKPEAITLNLLVGWFLSWFLSIESLIRYIEEESKQNDINAFIEIINIFVSKEKAKSGAKNTNRFLVHWFGLLAKNRFLIEKIVIKES